MTLIEIVVTIGIIVLLFSFVLSVIHSSIASAKRASCLSNLRTIAQMVEVYRQDHLEYPSATGPIGLNGIPDNGVTALALISADLSPKGFWCELDPFPRQFSNTLTSDNATQEQNALMRDLTNSTYSFGYNYYGYVTTVDGFPFPITTREAMVYFMGDPQKIDPAIPDDSQMRGWDLGVMKPDGTRNTKGVLTRDYRTDANIDAEDVHPAGLFQGLVNPHAPGDTVVTFCAHHPTDRPEIIPYVTLGGEAHFITPEAPESAFASDDYPVAGIPDTFFTAKRRHMHGDRASQLQSSNPSATIQALMQQYKKIPPIDWRVNKTSLSYGGAGENNKLIAETLYDPVAMPLVQVYYRQFDANVRWYDTGIDLQPRDMVMVVASAKWAWCPNDTTHERFNDGTQPRYVPFIKHKTDYDRISHDSNYGAQRKFLFNADGDPIEMAFPELLLDLVSADPDDYKPFIMQVAPGEYPPIAHSVLIGRVGNTTDTTKYFILGSRGSHFVKPDESGTLHLVMNDEDNDPSFSDNLGWCEAWIAVYRPSR
jgi:type II secretory pathway pseudopilin PulG